MKLLYSSIVLLILITTSTYAQTRQHKNAIYGNLGTVVVYAVGTVNAERYITSTKIGVPGSLSVRLGYGAWVEWGGNGGKVYLSSVNFLTGHKKSHFEIGAGPSFFTENDDEDQSRLLPNGEFEVIPGDKNDSKWMFGANVGYRYTSKFFMARAGVSWPETVYLGLGVTF